MYTLRVPFKIQDDAAIKNLEKDFSIGTFLISIKKDTNGYVLFVKGFNDEAAASKYFEKVKIGLSWVLLNCEIAPIFSQELSDIKYNADPVEAGKNLSKTFGRSEWEPVDGMIFDSDSVVIDANKNIKVFSGGNIRGEFGLDSKSFLKHFVNGINLRSNPNILKDKKLTVALELYSAYFSEASLNARFLTLTMVLESLSVQYDRPDRVVDFNKDIQDSIDNEIEKLIRYLEESKLDEASQQKIDLIRDELNSFEDLKQELQFRKKCSIKRSITTLVENTLKAAGHEDYEILTRRAKKLYDSRSKLVHEGELRNEDLVELTTELKRIVEFVLRAKLSV